MARNRWRLIGSVIVFVMLALVAGCGQDEEAGPLFQDSFDQSDSGWGADQRDEFERGYEDGEYFITVHRPNWFAWAHTGEQYQDVSVEVDAKDVSVAGDGHFGPLCRYVDGDNFYYFGISSDGFYAIFRRVDGGETEVLTGDGQHMQPSAAIKTGGQENHILAVCQGNELSLYVNGQLLEKVIDEELTQGELGLGVGSGGAGEVRVQFDNFVVTEP